MGDCTTHASVSNDDAPMLDFDRFGHRLRQVMAQADRTGEQVALHAVRLHVDDDVPAALVDQATAAIAGVVRHSDAIARLEGRILGVLQRNVSSGGAVAVMARRLIEAVDGLAETRTEPRVGIALHARDVGWRQLIARAVEALSEAESEECSYRVHSGPEIEPTVADREIVGVKQLTRALAEDELFVVFQPEFNLKTRQVMSFEALVRWQHPHRGVLSPGAFLPQVERCGLIDALSRWVLEHACRACQRWNDAWATSIPVAVNTSPTELQRPGFADRVVASLEATGLAPWLLELELTESFFLENTPRVRGELEALRHHGVRLAVDDFGMGFASLRYLRHFPVHKLKIPRELIGDETPSHMDRAIVEAIVKVGGLLGLEVIAEGVETAPQLEMLRALDCLGGQGFLLGRPGEPTWAGFEEPAVA